MPNRSWNFKVLMYMEEMREASLNLSESLKVISKHTRDGRQVYRLVFR